ncbi:hypothetical protein DWA26_20160, partial [Acinetobacter baumannii]
HAGNLHQKHLIFPSRLQLLLHHVVLSFSPKDLSIERIAKMLALCCFECFFRLNFIHLFLCQCVKKPSI